MIVHRASALFIAVGVIFVCLLASTASAACSVWPQPADMICSSSQSVAVAPAGFELSCAACGTVVPAAFARFMQQRYFFPYGNGETTSGISTLQVDIANATAPLVLGVDESYLLTATASAISIAAPTSWGALRAFETLAQLIDFDEAASTYSVPVAKISDAPRFPWRGLMIDTARHYLSLATIMRQIDAASWCKFNTLHWHVVDAESFPLCIPSQPLLCENGAYSRYGRYTLDNVTAIVEYGMARGVRVLLEFDMPGHAYGWGFGYPDLVTPCLGTANINNIPFNPSSPALFPFLTDFFNALLPVVADAYIHLGGDEVQTWCWTDNATIAAWMRDHKIDGGAGMLQYFVDSVYPMVTNAGKTVVTWEDLLDEGIVLPSEAVVQVWSNASRLSFTTSKGHRSLLSAGWYLNEQIPDQPPASSGEWEDTWKNMYAQEPTDFVPVANQHLILGGEVAMWGEQVDSTNIDSRVWPRAAAVAERLWTPLTAITNGTVAAPRLEAWRCRVAGRGLGAGPILPDWCLYPWLVISN